MKRVAIWTLWVIQLIFFVIAFAPLIRMGLTWDRWEFWVFLFGIASWAAFNDLRRDIKNGVRKYVGDISMEEE